MQPRFKKYLVFFGLGLSLFLAVCCGSSKNQTAKRSSELLDSLVVAKRFMVSVDRAQPMMTTSMQSIANAGLFPPGSAPGQLYLSGGYNILKVKGDSVEANLSYWGERQMGGGYNTRNSGIEFKGLAEDWEYSKNEKKGSHQFNFQVKNEMETFQVTINLFSQMNSNIQVNSNQRFTIGYTGTVKELENDSL